jgi:membrane-bound lytic murein transglycosylase B
MRIDYRLALIALVAACAPMAPPTQPPVEPGGAPAPAPAPQPVEPSQPAPAAPPGSMEFETWKAGFLARHGGANRAAFERELAGLSPDPSVIRLDGAQPEFSRPVGAYVSNAVSATRVAQARQRADAVPWSVEQQYGVPAPILLAIWAQESSFGAVQGDHDVIRSLATLAWEGRRRDWAEAQLRDALLIVTEGQRERARLKGSWAGAMGQTQFMPDNYRRLAVDGDGDGRRDIWGSPADALASAANLLSQAGWKRGQGWAYEVSLPSGFDYALAEGERQPWSFWNERGVSLTNGMSLSPAEAAEGATILLPQGANGPAFLALPNHYTIRRYNNSVAYALAIGLTADGVMGRPALSRAWPNEAPMSRDQRIGAQAALTRLGYDTQGIDGVVGANTRAALRRWQQANGLTPDGHLTAYLADQLIATR